MGLCTYFLGLFLNLTDASLPCGSIPQTQKFQEYYYMRLILIIYHMVNQAQKFQEYSQLNTMWYCVPGPKISGILEYIREGKGGWHMHVAHTPIRHVAHIYAYMTSRHTSHTRPCIHDTRHTHHTTHHTPRTRHPRFHPRGFKLKFIFSPNVMISLNFPNDLKLIVYRIIFLKYNFLIIWK